MLQCAIEAADDDVAIDGLAEEAHGAGRLRTPADPFLGEGKTLVVYEAANLLIILDNARSMRRTMANFRATGAA